MALEKMTTSENPSATTTTSTLVIEDETQALKLPITISDPRIMENGDTERRKIFATIQARGLLRPKILSEKVAKAVLQTWFDGEPPFMTKEDFATLSIVEITNTVLIKRVITKSWNIIKNMFEYKNCWRLPLPMTYNGEEAVLRRVTEVTCQRCRLLLMSPQRPSCFDCQDLSKVWQLSLVKSNTEKYQENQRTINGGTGRNQNTDQLMESVERDIPPVKILKHLQKAPDAMAVNQNVHVKTEISKISFHVLETKYGDDQNMLFYTWEDSNGHNCIPVW